MSLPTKKKKLRAQTQNFFTVAKEKHSSRLKRPKAAYMFFSIDMRKKLKETKPDLISNQIMQEISELWAHIDKEEKAKYESYG